MRPLTWFFLILLVLVSTPNIQEVEIEGKQGVQYSRVKQGSDLDARLNQSKFGTNQEYKYTNGSRMFVTFSVEEGQDR